MALVSAGALVYRAVTRARVEEPSSAVLVAPAPSVPSVPSAASAHASPNEAEFHAALAATPVTIYTASWCDVCRKTKRFLTVNGLHYREIDVDQTPGGWDKVESLTGKPGVPVVIVDGDISVGLDAVSVMRSVAHSMERRLGVSGINFTPS